MFFLFDRACKPGSVLVSEETSSRHLSSLGISPKFKPNGSATMKWTSSPVAKRLQIKVLHRIGFTADSCYHENG